MMTVMRIVSFAKYGGAEVLGISETARLRPGVGEILIQVAFAGVNRADLLQREGHYPPPAGASPVLGMEVSGYIEELGEGADVRWKVGDAVCALVTGGGYAEYCVAHDGCCLPVPEGLSLEDAGALPEAAFTVWANLFDPRRLFAGDRFLMQGGTSGIGTMAIQMARAFGARAVATAGSAEKCSFLKKLGCEAAFNYREEDWVAGVVGWSREQGVDAILDMVGGDYFVKHLKLLARDGRLVHIAFTRGNEVPLDLRAVMQKRLLITGSTLRPRSVAEKMALRDGLEREVWPLLETGKIRPIVDRVIPMEQVVEAHRRMESSQHIGKLLLAVGA